MATRKELEKKRADARDLYVRRGLTAIDISKLLKVSQKTLSKWKTADQWDQQAAAFTTTKGQELRRMFAQLKALHDAIEGREEGRRYPDAKEADAQNKLASAIKKLENEVGLASTLDVFIRFSEYLRGIDLKKAQEVSDLQDQYVNTLLSK